MRALFLTNLLIICVGVGYSFRISEFLDPFFKLDHNEHDRQSSEVDDQILPLFGFTFISSLIVNLFLTATGKKLLKFVFYFFVVCSFHFSACTYCNYSKKCYRYILQNCQHFTSIIVSGCGTANVRIVGGEEATENQLPWQCMIQNSDGSFYTCGATIISCDPVIIISAAHCFQGVEA